jgi:hypothetical protein
MSDVFTTIRDNPWILWLIAFTLSVFLPSGWGTRGVIRTFALGRRRNLEYLKKRRDRLQELRDCNREYYGWLLAGVLWVLALLGFQLALEGYMAIRPTWTLERQYVQSVSLTVVRFVMGIVIYTIALNRVLDDRSLRLHFDRTVGKLDRTIARLEAKQALHTPPVTAG